MVKQKPFDLAEACRKRFDSQSAKLRKAAYLWSRHIHGVELKSDNDSFGRLMHSRHYNLLEAILRIKNLVPRLEDHVRRKEVTRATARAVIFGIHSLLLKRLYMGEMTFYHSDGDWPVPSSRHPNYQRKFVEHVGRVMTGKEKNLDFGNLVNAGFWDRYIFSGKKLRIDFTDAGKMVFEVETGSGR